MESFVCEYCNKRMSTKYSLEYHKKNVKSCLKLQYENLGNYSCDGCDKNFKNDKTYQNHINSCNMLKKINEYLLKLKEKEEIIKEKEEIIKEKEEIIKEKEEIIQKITKQLDTCQSQIIYDKNIWEFEKEEYKRQIQFENKTHTIIKSKFEASEKLYKLQIERLEKYFQNIYKINTKLKSQLTHEYVIEKIKNHFTKEYLFKGIKGIVQFTVEYISKNDIGEKLYILCDKSRKKFKYNNGSETICDINAAKLKQMLYIPISTFYDSLRNEFETMELLGNQKIYNKNIKDLDYDDGKRMILESKELLDKLYAVAFDVSSLKNTKDNDFVNELIRQI